ncbi:hypothetical protein F7725_021504, partial [Dissostichus mawsoni]
MTHWYFPSLENSTSRSCRVVVYSVTSVSPTMPPCTLRWAWLWISASSRTSLSFFQEKVMGESLELAAEQMKVTLDPLRADCVSGCSVLHTVNASLTTHKLVLADGEHAAALQCLRVGAAGGDAGQEALLCHPDRKPLELAVTQQAGGVQPPAGRQHRAPFNAPTSLETAVPHLREGVGLDRHDGVITQISVERRRERGL